MWRQIQVLDSRGLGLSGYQALARGGAMLGVALAVLVRVIVLPRLVTFLGLTIPPFLLILSINRLISLEKGRP